MDQNAPVPHRREVRVETYDRPASSVVTSTPPPPPANARHPRRRRGSRWFIWLVGCLLAVVLVALLACALVGGLLMGIALKLANEVTASATSSQTFAISGVPSLDIRDPSGRVQVRPGASDVVSIQITKSARDSSETAARADLDKIAVNATQTGNQITLSIDFGDQGYFATSSSANLVISVPESTNIATDVTAGNIEINGIGGLMAITGGATSVVLRDVSLADGSWIHVTAGTVDVQGAIAPDATVDIAVDTGDVTLQLPADTATLLDARTNVGDIHITGWSLQPSQTNRVGAMANGSLGSPAMGAIHIQVNTGDITVSQQ